MNETSLTMRLPTPRICQLSKAGLGWLAQYLQCFEADDSDAWRAMLHPDCTLQINNNVPVYGIEALAPVVDRLRARYGALRREVLNVYGDDQSMGLEMLWHFTRLDGAAVSIPAASFVDRDDDGLVTAIRTFADTTPVFD